MKSFLNRVKTSYARIISRGQCGSNLGGAGFKIPIKTKIVVQIKPRADAVQISSFKTWRKSSWVINPWTEAPKSFQQVTSACRLILLECGKQSQGCSLPCSKRKLTSEQKKLINWQRKGAVYALYLIAFYFLCHLPTCWKTQVCGLHMQKCA